jgi:8-amino-7-oxononanoate synthase
MRKVADELETIRQANLLRRLRLTASSGEPGTAQPHNFASNDYLGLSQDAGLKQAFAEGILRHGSGSGASRLVSGTYAPHLALEEELAELKGTEAALTFSSGYATALGVIPALVGKNDFLLLDKLCHASLIDAARLSGARLRVFHHNDTEKLARLLDWSQREKSPDDRVIIVTESLFSMDGDTAPLQEIIEEKNRHGAWLLLDEAHAFGVYGPRGQGLAAELGLGDQVELQMGTFSKAAGLSGGYLAGSRDVIDLLINKARSFIYSTAPAPALAEATRHALQLIASEKGAQLRLNLQTRIKRFLESPAGSLSLVKGAIQPVILGEEAAALQASAELADNGYFVPAIRYPTVAKGRARLRVTLSATHNLAAIDSFCALLSRFPINPDPNPNT